jgi:hypothetical protein
LQNRNAPACEKCAKMGLSGGRKGVVCAARAGDGFRPPERLGRPIPADNLRVTTPARSSSFAAGSVRSATTAASSSSTCATATAPPRWSAIPMTTRRLPRPRARRVHEFVIRSQGQVARPPRQHGQLPPLHRRHRSLRQRRAAQHQPDPAVPDRRRAGLARSPKTCASSTATSTCAAPRCSAACACATRWPWLCASYMDTLGFIESRDAHSHQEHARRRARLPRAQPRDPRHLLRACPRPRSSTSSC